MRCVPVVGSDGKPLMPCHPARARELVREGKAIRRFERGLFYIKLTEREDGNTQPIAVGIDPGSKKEAFTVKSEAHTYLNIQADAITWVSEAEETSTTMRGSRRGRKTPYRKMRVMRNNNKQFLPPSTRARWQWKLNIAKRLAKLYPISAFVIEDIKATTRKGKNGQWNKSFSPLQVGKDYFYYQLGRLAPVELIRGYQTAELRNNLKLKKISDKLSDSFEAHCVDSWILTNWYVGGHDEPENKSIVYIVPLRFHRRQLHMLKPSKGGVRKPYGGTMSFGLKRGSWVKHKKYGVCYVGGCDLKNSRISLHSLQDGKRLCQNAKPEDCQFLCTSSWRIKKSNA